MNIFEDLLSEIFDGYDSIKNEEFMGRSMIAKLDDELRVKVSVSTLNIHEMYELVLVKIINRVDGEVDRHGFAFRNYFDNRICCMFSSNKYVWEYGKPSRKQIKNLATDIRNYIDIFRA